MSKICGIYVITNMRDGKRYVGSSKDIDKRFKQHVSGLRHNKHSSIHLQHAWNRDGSKAFDFSVCTICDERDLINREQHYIDHFQSQHRDTGYNIIPRADRREHSQETRDKISLAKKGTHHTQEACAKISAALRLRVRGEISLETREKIGAAQRGRKRSPEFCAKIAAANIGKKFTREAIVKSASMRRGVKLSEEHVAKLAESHRGFKPKAESIAKTAEFNRGRKRKPETIEKSAAKRRGQKRTPEQCQRIAAGTIAANARKRLVSRQFTLTFAELDLA